MKKHNNSQFVFVLAPNGEPLMPTLRGGRVRWLLKTGNAKVIKRIPFTIQILDESVGRETQDITLGINTGTGNIGVSAVSTETGIEYISATYETNTQGIKAKMEKRGAFRHTRTRFKRDLKKRRAKANGTTRKTLQRFTVSGAETETVAKDIRSSLCRLDKNVDNGKLYTEVVQGNSNGGAYVRLVSNPSKNIKPRLCRLIQKSTGFVRIA